MKHVVYENNKALFAEGKARIYTKYLEKNKEGQTVESEVFYNPIQVFNRDLSVLAIQGFINLIKQERTLQPTQVATSSRGPSSQTHFRPADSGPSATSKNSRGSRQSSPTISCPHPTNS